MRWLARALGSLLCAASALAFCSPACAEEPSSVYILTRPEIASLGAHTLPEVLRVMPGIRVTGSGDRDWAVTASGRGSGSEGRLLVLVDGKQIEALSAHPSAAAPLLSEIDRIELIRGRAAALWGKTASNGVLQIITTKAR